VFFICIVKITSLLFGVLSLCMEQEEKCIIIKKMRDDGFTYLEISDFLNTSNYKPQRTDNFSSQLVFGLFDKMNTQIKRF
jgi:hypothetical protein